MGLFEQAPIAANANADGAALLQVHGLSVAYRSAGKWTPVLHDVSFDVRPGETVALIGESGSGKTTVASAVLRILASNARITSGAVIFQDVDVVRASRRQLRRVRSQHLGYVPQDPTVSMNPIRTVRSQLDEAVRFSGAQPGDGIGERVRKLLHLAGISETDRVLDAYPHQLSGGLLQRVLIAAAIAGRPRLLIADEPTSALDATIQKGILDTLAQLRAELGLAVLMVTHDLSIAAEHSDRIVTLDRGKVVEHGPTRTVIAAPTSPYARALFASAPRPVATTLTRRSAEPLPADGPDFGRVAGNSEAPALAVTNITKVYGHGDSAFRAVEDVSFTVAAATTHALVGESGSGKTTLARIVLGLVRPDAGIVEVCGRRIDATDRDGLRRVRRDLQLVHQNPFGSLDPRFTVQRIIGEPMLRYREGDRRQRRGRVAELADAVGLPQDSLHRKARELSGGQRQRVAIARALALNPKLIVLDEPTSALDVRVQEQVLELLRILQRRLALSYLFISHDLRVVAKLADTVTVLHAGRVVESGPIGEIFRSPNREYTKVLLDSVL